MRYKLVWSRAWSGNALQESTYLDARPWGGSRPKPPKKMPRWLVDSQRLPPPGLGITKRETRGELEKRLPAFASFLALRRQGLE